MVEQAWRLTGASSTDPMGTVVTEPRMGHTARQARGCARVLPDAARTIAALIVLRAHVIAPILGGGCTPAADGRKPTHPLDHH